MLYIRYHIIYTRCHDVTEKNLRGINMATAARIYRTWKKTWREVRGNVEEGEEILEKKQEI